MACILSWKNAGDLTIELGAIEKGIFLSSILISGEFYLYTPGHEIREFIATALMWEIEASLKRDDSSRLDIFAERKSAFDTTK